MRDAFVKMLHLFRPADRTAADAYHSRYGSSPDRARSRRSHSRESIAGLAGAPALLRDGRRHDPTASRAVWLPFRQPQPVSFSFWPSCLSSPSEGSKTAANLGSRRGGGGVMGKGAKRSYSASPADYRLLEEVGYGASATVYRAIYVPFNEIVAVKCLDLDRCNGNLDDIRREAQTMSLIDHPNVVRAFCSFVVDHCLWVVMPFMAEGSCMHLMKAAYPDGFEESVIGSMLKETLKALEYLHRHGHIHRDVKAGNILLDNSGGVKLGDFGVSACMFDKGDRQRSRNTFVGTPCWMAPEVLQPGSGYDFKADIWSFGITALELAHGHAPFSKYPPMKVLLMTLQNAPPGLDYERDRRFSKAFKEMVAMCLVKDQTKRPTAEKLLKHSFFKQAKPPELSVKNILAGLPPLWDRVKTLQLKDAAQLALKKMPSAEQEALSQSEYQRGVSAWNFDIEDLKAQASLIQDDEDLPGRKEDNGGPSLLIDDKRPSGSRVDLEKSLSSDGCDYRKDNCVADELDTGRSNRKGEILESELLDSSNLEKDDGKENRLKHDLSPSQRNMEHNSWKNELARRPQTYSGPILSATALNNSLSGKGHNCGSESPLATEKQKREVRKAPNFSGPLLLPNRASTNSLSAPVRSTGYADSSEDKLRSSVVQIKGRFSVTSEHVDPVKGTSLRKSASVGDWFVNSKQVPSSQPSKEVNNIQLPASVLMPQLQNLVQQTSFQQDLIRHLLESLQQNELVDALQSGMPSQVLQSDNASVPETATSERERLLLVKIAELQIRMNSLTDELIAAKAHHIKLQQQLNAVCGQEEERIKEVGA